MMFDEAKTIVCKLLPEKRFQHTLRVVETATVLADKYGEDINSIQLSAILHDITKYFSATDQEQLIKRAPKEDQAVLNYHIELWHAKSGAVYVQEKLGITNEAVLKGIKSHTTGRKGMSVFEKIIFLADYIEPGRNFPGVQDVRELVEKSLNAAVLKALKNTIQFLISRQQRVYPDTIEAYNDMILNLEAYE